MPLRYTLVVLLSLVLSWGALAQNGDTVLLIPDSINDRIILLDAETGDVIDLDYIVEPDVFGTIVKVLPNFDGTGIFVSDQTEDVVHEFDALGNYVGPFLPAGGADEEVIDNIRGIAYDPTGSTLLVSALGGANPDAVVAFDSDGELVAPFISSEAGGLSNPWDIFFREDDVLVSASGSSAVLRYRLDGVFLDAFAEDLNFPQQISGTASGTVLVANFSPVSTRGVWEYEPDGTVVAHYSFPPLLGATRGVHELPNGNLLVATTAGIYEFNRDAELVDTKVEGGQYRWISEVPASVVLTSGEAAATATTFSLGSAYPNPATGSVQMDLTVESAQIVRVAVYDLLGREVAVLHEGALPAGHATTLRLDGTRLAAGTYLVRAVGEREQAAVRVTLVR